MIEELKKEHSVIINTLNNAKKLGIHTKEGHEELLSAKKEILIHMKKEDKKLYFVLRKAAKSNQKLKDILNEFDKDMDEISSYTCNFFDNYSALTENELAMEIDKFIEILNTRILREKTFLFAEYEKLHQ